MAYTAEQFVTNALATKTNDPGYCLQQTRIWAGIAAKYPDAATAWRNTIDRHPGDRKVPRGAVPYWTGGSNGFGHIACSLGGGNIRTTDYPSGGKTGTTDLGWVERAWGLVYAGWAWDINGVTIPHGSDSGGGSTGKDEDVPDYVSAACRKGKTLEPNEWWPIAWDQLNSGKDYLAEGQPNVKVTGPYSATLNVDVSDRQGGTVQLQFIEYDTKANQVAETGQPDAVGAVDNSRTAQVGSVGKGRVLRARVRASKGGHLDLATIQLLTFQPK